MKNVISKYNLKNISKRLQAFALVGALAFTSVGCNSKEQVKEEATTEVETTVDANQEAYNEIINLEKNIVSFGEKSLPNGFVDLNESNKLEMAKLFTNAYIQMNSSTINKKSLAVLDQDLDLVSRDMTNDFMEFSTLVARYSQISTPETVLPFDNFIEDENDCEFINNLSTKVAEMNVCTDEVSRQAKINEIVEIKESLLTNANIAIDYNSETLYLATKIIIYSDAMAKAYGSEIITSEEEQMQLYTSFYDNYCETSKSSGYIEETDIDNSEISSPSSFESKYLSTSDKVMGSIIDKISEFRNEEYDEEYSYSAVTKYIAEKLVGLYVAPTMNNIDAENAIRKATSELINSGNIGKTTTTTVDPSQVPASEQVPSTTKVTDANGNETTDYYMEGYVKGRTNGSNAAYSLQTSSGSIPSTISASSAPSPSSSNSEYIRGYKAGYAEGWNAYVSSAKSAQSAPTTTTTPTDGPSSEEVIEEGNVKPGVDVDPSDDYVPVAPGTTDEEEVIEEGTLTSSRADILKSLREVAEVYTNSYYASIDDDNVKTM